MARRKKHPQHLKPVLVEWIDAFDGPGGWVFPKDYKADGVFPKTLGWYLREDPEYHVLVSTWYQEEKDEVASNPMHIPKAWIKSMRFLDF
jgi:hypothetical protein